MLLSGLLRGVELLPPNTSSALMMGISTLEALVGIGCEAFWMDLPDLAEEEAFLLEDILTVGKKSVASGLKLV